VRPADETPYTTGLHEVADGVFAWLQPDGGWGWSNAGLLATDGGSLLVDTLFDLELTRTMLDAMAPITDTRPIGTLVNTHANGDHCYGNSLVTDAEVVTTEAAAREMGAVPPSALVALLQADMGEVANDYVQQAFGSFTFEGITVPEPTRTFTGRLEIEIGGIQVHLEQVGPAHTAGDLLVHLPDASTVFTGDILFVMGTPIIWDGPVANWVAACDRIIDLDCDVIIPGHGPAHRRRRRPGGPRLPDLAGGRLPGPPRHRHERRRHRRRPGRLGRFRAVPAVGRVGTPRRQRAGHLP